MCSIVHQLSHQLFKPFVSTLRSLTLSSCVFVAYFRENFCSGFWLSCILQLVLPMSIQVHGIRALSKSNQAFHADFILQILRITLSFGGRSQSLKYRCQVVSKGMTGCLIRRHWYRPPDQDPVCKVAFMVGLKIISFSAVFMEPLGSSRTLPYFHTPCYSSSWPYGKILKQLSREANLR